MTDASKAGRRRRPSPALIIRQLHAHIGMLVAPTVLFLAATGILQIYDLHEAHGRYAPAPLIEKLSAVHKDQEFKLKDDGGPPSSAPKPGPGAGSDPGPPPAHHHQSKLAVVLLKAYFAGVALALIVSTCLGIKMALGQGPRRRTYAWLLLIGTLVPVALAAMSG